MEVTNIRQRLYHYVNRGDAKLLRLLYAVAKEYTEGDDFAFTEEEINLLEERRSRRLSGESKVSNWEDVQIKPSTGV